LISFQNRNKMKLRFSSNMRLSDRISEYLKKNDLKFTAGRRIILERIKSCEGHFDADELYELLRQDGEKVSRATVYRTLPLLVKMGVIKETLRSGARARYEHAFGHAHHDHLECIACGRIIEFKVDGIEMLQEKLCRKNGFVPVYHELFIRGYCASCAAKR
jgi:Fur family ferric uptake transcriptional regulator